MKENESKLSTSNVGRKNGEVASLLSQDNSSVNESRQGEMLPTVWLNDPVDVTTAASVDVGLGGSASLPPSDCITRLKCPASSETD